MNVQLNGDILKEIFELYLGFHQKVFITFDISKLVIHGQTNCSRIYTKTAIDEDKMDYYINNFVERKSYEGILTQPKKNKPSKSLS